VRWPDAIKSNGGGCNAVLVRGGSSAVLESRALRLALLPERRWVLGVRLAGWGGVWAGNVHLTGSTDGAAARREARSAADAILGWSEGAPIVLGGDFNLRRLSLPGFALVATSGIDHVFAHGLEAFAATVLDPGALSDHVPVLAEVTPAARRGSGPAR
jgi:endonuclease/exonuclease/phosphatase (EEP) superfamily protein YafD